MNWQRWKVYLLTFLCYVSIHNMRMSYSQVKSDFKSDFQQSDLFLALFDALVYLSLGTGFFFRFLLQGKKKMLNSLLMFLGIACIGYLIIPINSLLFKEKAQDSYFIKEILPGMGLLIFGFFQFPAWPTLLTITSQEFELNGDGTAMGIWSANGDLGNIVGFALTGFLVSNLEMRW
jgi:sugar phosphate permease